MDGDGSGGGGGKERDKRRLECVTIRLGNRGAIRPNLGGVDVIAGVDAVFEPNGTRLPCGTVIIALMSIRGRVKDASNTNVSMPSVDIICRRAATTPSWPAI